jgi:tetratricopeptide (TPR) repeat protein
MAGPRRKRWITPPRWTGHLTDFVDRRMDRLSGGTARSLEITDSWLARAQRSHGPDSWKTVNMMEAAAKRRDQVGDHERALGLRFHVLAKRREHLGAGHRQTLSAEYALSGTLLALGRPAEARPHVDHALECYVAELGPDDPASLTALERSARIHLELGETAEGILKYRRAVDGFRSRGDEVRAQRAGVNQGRLLLGRGDHEDALAVFRDLVDRQGLLLGPHDPATLASRRDLALCLARTGRLTEAKVVAQNLRDAAAQVHGDDHPATADARELLARIEASLPPG